MSKLLNSVLCQNLLSDQHDLHVPSRNPVLLKLISIEHAGIKALAHTPYYSRLSAVCHGGVLRQQGPRPLASKKTGSALITADAKHVRLEAILYVQIRHLQGVFLNEVAAWLHHIAHQSRKNILGIIHMTDTDLQKRANVRIQRRLPELIRIHFA